MVEKYTERSQTTETKGDCVIASTDNARDVKSCVFNVELRSSVGYIERVQGYCSGIVIGACTYVWLCPRCGEWDTFSSILGSFGE
jgi:lipopolysaccharide biosynthesis regulator YciM